MQMLSSYSEGALKNYQQLSRAAGAVPVAFQAHDEGGLLGSTPLILPHKSLGLGEAVFGHDSLLPGLTRVVLAK